MENERKTRRWSGHIEHWQIVAILLAVYDFVAVCVSYFLALWLRFDGTYSAIPEQYLDPYTAVDFALIQEMTMNHDAYNNWPKNGPKSTYMYKDSAGVMCFGPMWDYDYHTFTLYGDFEYGNTTWNSTENQRLYQWEIMKMTNKNGTYYFSDLKRNPEFKALLIERWNTLKEVWKEGFEDYVDEVAEKIRVSESYNKQLWGYPSRENGDWQLTFDQAIEALKTAFNKRWTWIDQNIGNL